MNIGDIAERFIRAAEVERATPEHIGPMPPRSIDLGYVHDWVDKMGWRKAKERRVVKKGRLIQGDWLTEDPLAEERRIFWEKMVLCASASELSELEELRDWLMLVDDVGQRRALLAWAMAKAGGRKFKSWCFKVEGIHPETGRRRKDRALARIHAQLSGSDVQNCDSSDSGVLPSGPEIDHDFDTLGTEPGKRAQANSWMADGALARVISDAPDFSWAQKRWQRRRQREAERAKKPA